MNLWQLPTSARLGDKEYPHRTDFREILRIFSMLTDDSRPELYRWYLALAYFFREPIPREAEAEAVGYLAGFLTCGDPGKPGPKLLDWQQDAQEIIADVNAVAGCEIRAMEYLHWWSFLSFFYAIGDGRLSTLVGIREKLLRGKKLEPWEQAYYLRNKEKVRLRPRETPADAAEKERLSRLLSGE